MSTAEKLPPLTPDGWWYINTLEELGRLPEALYDIDYLCRVNACVTLLRLEATKICNGFGQLTFLDGKRSCTVFRVRPAENIPLSFDHYRKMAIDASNDVLNKSQENYKGPQL